MPPTSDGGERTICCSAHKAIPDAEIRADLQVVVARAHRIGILASEVVNIHVRQQLEWHGSCPAHIFDKNWCIHAMRAVSSIRGAPPVVHPTLQDAIATIPHFQPVQGAGLTQLLQFSATNMAATARNNVWMHFRRRISKNVRLLFDESDRPRGKEQRRAHAIRCARIAASICALPGEVYELQSADVTWVQARRRELGLEDVLSSVEGGDLERRLKKTPERFMPAMRVMAADLEARDRRRTALYPLRRHMVDRFVHLDARALNSCLQAVRCERLGRKQKCETDDEFTFSSVFNTHAAGIVQRWRLQDGVDTDGVAVHFKQIRGGLEKVSRARENRKRKYDAMAQGRREAFAAKAEGRKRTPREQPARTSYQKKSSHVEPLSSLPRRGLYCIDALKRISRQEYQVVGVDPGKHNIVQAVDSERRSSRAGSVRYTLRERNCDMRTRQYAAEGLRGKPVHVRDGEALLATQSSKAVSVTGFVEYCACRRSFLDDALDFYGGVEHRRRRRKRAIKTQQSEEKLVKRLQGLQTDIKRPLVLAYGSWGATTSKGFKGLPPCVGVGLVRRLAHRFVVAVTPEHYTSKTCARCLGPCGPHPTLRHEVGQDSGLSREIRGLRVCQNEACKQIANRDHMGACNIATNFERLVAGHTTIAQLTAEDAELNRLRCIECGNEE